MAPPMDVPTSSREHSRGTMRLSKNLEMRPLVMRSRVSLGREILRSSAVLNSKRGGVILSRSRTSRDLWQRSNASVRLESESACCEAASWQKGHGHLCRQSSRISLSRDEMSRSVTG